MSIRLTSFDFSSPQQAGAVFYWVGMTDYYRRTRPYKIFHVPGKSRVSFSFILPPGNEFSGVRLSLNHCRTTADGVIDLVVNGLPQLIEYHDTPRYNFGFQSFTIDARLCRQGRNEIEIQLHHSSPGVYWLSDATVDLELPSMLPQQQPAEQQDVSTNGSGQVAEILLKHQRTTRANFIRPADGDGIGGGTRDAGQSESDISIKKMSDLRLSSSGKKLQKRLAAKRPLRSRAAKRREIV